MNPRVKYVKPLESYKLELEFDNGEKKLFDVSPFLKIGKFSELKNDNMFKSVVSYLGSIQWSNGLDLCPDTLYENGVPYNVK
ncbi:MAG: DUF2442 domain-containing protein [Ignavibacteriota bacterium]|nr:DUF2442 domain-containing protein [Ignavibacteriota bacterium]